MRLLSVILTLVLAVLVGGAWIYGTHQPRPVFVKSDALFSSDSSVKSSRPVAVIGKVQPSSRRNTGSSEWWFTLEEDGRTIPIHYTGQVPSTFFEDGAKVLVIGTMRDGTFSARDLAVSARM